jgi:hypothetical protein
VFGKVRKKGTEKLGKALVLGTNCESLNKVSETKLFFCEDDFLVCLILIKVVARQMAHKFGYNVCFLSFSLVKKIFFAIFVPVNA